MQKKIEAQVQAFVNKLRVKNTTVLTDETLAKVTKQVKTDNTNEQDLRRRQLQLETIIAKQNERINHFVKEHQQKTRKAAIQHRGQANSNRTQSNIPQPAERPYASHLRNLLHNS